jgi:hypothetical protein
LVEVAYSAGGDVCKARLILALAEGKSDSAVEAEWNTSRPAIARWRLASNKPGSKGWKDNIRAAVLARRPLRQARILKKTQQKPAEGSTHWSYRKMRAAVGVSPIGWIATWASNDPALEERQRR